MSKKFQQKHEHTFQENFPAGKIGTTKLTSARLAQSVERKALNLVVVGSSPTVGGYILFVFCGRSKSFQFLVGLA